MKYNWRTLYTALALGTALAVSAPAISENKADEKTNMNQTAKPPEDNAKKPDVQTNKKTSQDVSIERIKQYREQKHKKQLPSRGGYRRVPANVSAYTLLECGDNAGVTASGKIVRKGETIAASKQLPFGTEIYIPEFDPASPLFRELPADLQKYLGTSGYDGFFTVEDRGGAIKGKKLDVYFGSSRVAKNHALKFGRRNLTAYVIK